MNDPASMGSPARYAILGLFLLLSSQPTVFSQVSIPANYHAVEHRAVVVEPALPTAGAAGAQFADPAFGSRLLRVTDGTIDTRPGFGGGSFSTPSAAHQLAWSATSDRFYVRSISGWYFAFDFDAAAMRATRIQMPTNNGLIETQIEPQFSFRSGNILYTGWRDQTVLDHDYPVVQQYDFNTGQYTMLLNLRLAPALAPPDTYIGAISSSAATPEKVAVLFGGNQDSNFKVAVFQPGPPASNITIVNTKPTAPSATGTLDGNPVMMTDGTPLDFYLHHAWIDLSGRYVVLYPVAATPAPFVLWDLTTGTFTPVRTLGSGHDALGYGWQVNQDCCSSGSAYDGAQWQLRSLTSPTVTTDLIAPLPSPRQIYVADHTSWNNAQPDRLVPILSSVYRYYDGSFNTTPWRAWDNEIVAIQTDAGSAGAAVWRFAHHRSDVARDDVDQFGNPIPGTYFWYQPHAVISPNGRWAMFTSNWEKSLGLTATPEPSGKYRTDVFIVGLTAGTFTDDPLLSGVTTVKALHMTELRTRIDVLRASYGLSPFAWTDPSLTARVTTIKAAHINDLRTALTQAYVAAGRALPSFTGVLTVGVTPIRAVHIQELRQAVVNLEGS